MSEDTPDLEIVARRIRGLQAKTKANGATEAEAMAAAAKARELMDRHRLSMTDLQVQAEPIDQVVMDRPNKSKFSAVDYCVGGIGRYCGVKMWFSCSRERAHSNKVRRITLFGLRGDVAMAQYLYDMLVDVIKAEAEAFHLKTMASFEDLASQAAYDSRAGKVSFQVGMAHRINARLIEMAKELEPTAMTGSGTALVVVKNALVDDAYAKLGLRLGTLKAGMSARDGAAYTRGAEAGNRVNLRRPVGARAGDKQLS